jgi:hypothetical protein
LWGQGFCPAAGLLAGVGANLYPLNAPNFNVPNRTAFTANFGRVSSAQDSRQLQFALNSFFKWGRRFRLPILWGQGFCPAAGLLAGVGTNLYP